MHCPSKKTGYETADIAIQALIDHRARFNHTVNSGPINIYHCDLCDDWHFTSKGVVHKSLMEESALKKTKLLREAYEWERKLK